MGEINHFSHVEHSLKLIENWDTIVDDHGEGKGEVQCKGCREPISILGGSAYGCISCRYFLHKTCAQLPPAINHKSHPFHPLTLTNNSFQCDLCDNRHQSIKGFSYRCIRCDFDACAKCGVVFVAQQAAAAALKEEASIKFEHEGHPQHKLTLQLRPAAFLCDACNTKDEGLFYQCDSCDFWIHKSCASLAPTINLAHHPNHPLVLIYFLPERFYNYPYFCEFCNKRVLQNDWLYHCANCRYFAHIKCALKAEQSSISRDPAGTSAVVAEEHGNELLHFPMSYKFTDPLKLLYSGKLSSDDDEDSVEVNHWSHDHILILNVEPRDKSIMTDFNSGDLIEVCYGCVRPLSFPYYTCKAGCSFTLHKYCAELPRTLQHQLHPHHPLCLVKTATSYCCDGCSGRGNTFVYICENLEFEICVNCAFLPNTIKHKSHDHPLLQLINSGHQCQACYNWTFYGMSYACEACGFHLHMHCAMRLSQSLAHRYCKGDEVLLTYPPVENHPEDFYCDICETEMHPKRPLYHCQNHKNSFHLKCLSHIDDYANMWKEGTITVSYHKHPLTYVRRKKTPKYVCSKCNQDINGFLVLECRARVCNFVICYYCYLN